MAVKKILPTDTLETGFRAKYNETVDEIITGYEYPAAVGLQPNGKTLRLKKFGGGYIDIDLGQFYFTKQEVTNLINGISGKYTVNKTGADVDVNGFIDVSADANFTNDLIGCYLRGAAIYSDIKYDPSTRTVGPFDVSSINPGDDILLRFI